jgi:two-component system, OmpR family, response regulator
MATHDGTSCDGQERRLRVLIADDNQDAANNLARLVTLWGFEVAVAIDGPSTLSLAEAYAPHVVFLDIAVAKMDGFAVAKRIRTRPQLKDVLLVAVSGHVDEASRLRSEQIGVAKYMVKPVDPEYIRLLLVAQAEVVKNR